jgi:hypothetical protein
LSKILEATCVGGVVKVGALPVLDAVILSKGIGSSSGVLLMEGDKKTYVAKTSPDLGSTLEKLEAILTQLTTSLSEISTALTSAATAFTATQAVTGPSWVPPVALGTSAAVIAAQVSLLTADGVALTAIKAEITLLKESLK